MEALDGKQVQRWSEAEVPAYEEGHRPPCPANEPQLLVVRMDGGRCHDIAKSLFQSRTAVNT